MTRAALSALVALAAIPALAANRARPVAIATPSGAEPSGLVVASNMQDNTATVLDAATGEVLRTLPTGDGPHEVAATHDGRWAVVSNYGPRGKPGNTITVIDLRRLEVARTLDLGDYRRPHGMKFLEGDSVLALTSEVSQAVVLVAFPGGKILATVPTQGRGSHMLALARGDSVAFTSNVADGTISQLDPRRRVNERVIPVARLVEGITVTPDGRSAWVGSNADSIVVVVDVATGAATDTLRGFGMPYRLAATPDGRSVVVTDPVRSEVRVFDARTRRERLRIPVPREGVLATAEVAGSPSPEGVTISSDSRWAFVTLQGANELATIDLSDGRIVRLSPTGTGSDGVAYAPRGP